VHPVVLTERSSAAGKTLGELDLPGVAVTMLVRKRERHPDPPPDMQLEPGDVLVLFGRNTDVLHAEDALLGR